MIQFIYDKTHSWKKSIGLDKTLFQIVGISENSKRENKKAWTSSHLLLLYVYLE